MINTVELTIASKERSAKSIAVDMENDLAVIKNLANAIIFTAAELDLKDEVRSAIECLTYIILEKGRTLEKLRLRAAGQDRTSGAAALPQEQTPGAVVEDRALLALGEELNQLLADWKAQKELDQKMKQAVDAEVKAATGIAIEDAPPKESDPTGYWKTRDDIWASKPEYAPELTRWAKLNDRLAALVTPILALTARTPVGLAI